MNRFTTTADIRSLDDSSTSKYVSRYIFAWAATFVVDWIASSFGYEFLDTKGAALAAYACSIPRSTPAFRSITRFVVSLILAAALAHLYWYVSLRLSMNTESAFQSVVSAVIATLAMAAVEGIVFLRTCLVTPGRLENH
ncbi:hypothetical protein [Rhodopirellula bahusiensis]|uniref:hypothetical protein n=1 Tax=Rhodopirellula bahusiensis TaxID=2014065 RepID=UPI00329891EA